MNRYLDRKSKDNTSNRHGRQSEKKQMKSLGARQMPGSGSIEGAKSDGESSIYRYESKSTLHASWAIKHEILKKIAREASGYNQVPVQTLSFVLGSGKSVPQGDYVIMTKKDFAELNDAVYGEGCW